NAQINKVDAFITAKDGAVKKEAGVTSTVNVYLGGGDNQALDFSNGGGVENANIASGADTLHVNTTGLITLKDATSFGNNLKLDLDDAIASNIAINEVAANSGDLTALFVNASDNDKISLTLASGNKGVTLTNAAETIKLNANSTEVVFTNFTQGANKDKIDYSAINDSVKDNIAAGSSASTKMTTNDKAAYYIELSANYTKATKGSEIKDGFKSDSLNAVFASAVSGKKATVVAKYNDKTAIYQLTADDTAGLENDTVTLIATIDSAVDGIDAAKALFGTL
ncbi:MAG: hypothetical protein ACI35K_06105, partial [Campylobacter sp.]